MCAAELFCNEDTALRIINRIPAMEKNVGATGHTCHPRSVPRLRLALRLLRPGGVDRGAEVAPVGRGVGFSLEVLFGQGQFEFD